ncbi:hypothetical protein EDI_046670 [Entamoeba dispar SAW760]|uniref:Uncharacterized protein n=1 Tax=Entamoeba dispar (strain ATCC PRA-260 / SAW760) TaxID=370354 RepID=B0ELH2_ENTDS|nr:uncharacterized protein EDI_046670 [Entamoeba dispar SAW760]EDR24629.1 hypothetical protein EDI_046670 [Entamoeba dispar SAW760]|eukprot:EDR24629.1 hypothetical protein EDI_046670 [Entamoeba dispar SAW760]
MSNKRNVDQFLISLNNLSKSLELSHFNFEIDLFNESFTEITKINEKINHIKTIEEKDKAILDTHLLVASTFGSFVKQFKEIIAKDKSNLQKVMTVVKGKKVLERSEYYNQGRKSFERVRFLLKQLSFLEITKNFIVDKISSYSPKPIDKNVSIEKQKELRSMIYLLFSVANELMKFNENNFKIVGKHVDFTVICNKEVLKKYIKEKRLVTNEFILNETVSQKLEKESIKEEISNLSRINGCGFLGYSFDSIVNAFEQEIRNTLPYGFSFSFNKENNKEEYRAELEASQLVNGTIPPIELTQFNNFKQFKKSFVLQKVNSLTFQYDGKGEGSSLFGLKPFDIEITITVIQKEFKLIGILSHNFLERSTPYEINTIGISGLSVLPKKIKSDHVIPLNSCNSNIDSVMRIQPEMDIRLIAFKEFLSYERIGDTLYYSLTMPSKFQGRNITLIIEDYLGEKSELELKLEDRMVYVYDGLKFYFEDNGWAKKFVISVSLFDIDAGPNN